MNLGPNAVNDTFRFLLNQSGSSITLGDNSPVNWDAGNVVAKTGTQAIGGDKTFSSLNFIVSGGYFGGASDIISIGKVLGSNAFGASALNNTFGASASNNAFGASASTNTFGNLCITNSFGGPNVNTYGGSAVNNSFGALAINNNFGLSATANNFGSGSNNTFGSGLFSGPVRLRLPSFSGASNQAGQLGEIRTSGSGIYICTGSASGWGRFFVSTF
jgi:hypothetical protein